MQLQLRQIGETWQELIELEFKPFIPYVYFLENGGVSLWL